MNPPSDTVRCICGQVNPADAQLCSNCQESLALVPYRSEAPAGDPATRFSLARLLVVIGVAAAVLGILILAPGLAILVAALALPALIRTVFVVQRRKELGKEVSPSKNTVLFLVSFGTTILVTTVAVAICVGTFCGVFFTVNGDTYQTVERDIVIAGSATLVVAIGVLVAMVRLAKWRWRRDVNKP